MSEHNITIGGATFYLRAAKGKDARHLFKMDNKGNLKMEQMLDPATVANFVIEITGGEWETFSCTGDAKETFLAEMPLQDFMQLVGKVYELAALTEDSAKNSDSSSTSHKTKKGEDNSTAKPAQG